MYGIFTYIYYKNQPNVGEYTSPMDPMGKKAIMFVDPLCSFRNVSREPYLLPLLQLQPPLGPVDAPAISP